MKTLEMFFENEEGRTVKYTLDKPLEDLDPEAVNAAMDEVIEQEAFHSSGGNIIAKKSARIVEKVIEDIELDI